MSIVTAFELHRYRDGRWTIDSIYDSLDMAQFEGRRLLSGRYALGVRIVEETYDPGSGDNRSRVVCEMTKDQAPAMSHDAPAPAAALPQSVTKTQTPPSDSTFVRNLVILILVTGGLGIAVVIALLALQEYLA